MAKYQIILDDNQLNALLAATEAYSRLCKGQIRYALDQAWGEKIFKLPQTYRELLDTKCRQITLLISDGKHDEIDKLAVIAYNIQQVLRNQKWKEEPESRKTVYSTHSSVTIANGEEPIKIEKIGD